MIGIKINMIFYQGFPIVRVQLAKRFAEAGGFTLLLELLKQPSAVATWFRAEAAFIILKAIWDVLVC